MLWLDNLGFLPDNHSIYYVVFELILIFVHIPKLFFRNANDFDSKTPSSNAEGVTTLAKWFFYDLWIHTHRIKALELNLER